MCASVRSFAPVFRCNSFLIFFLVFFLFLAAASLLVLVRIFARMPDLLPLG